MATEFVITVERSAGNAEVGEIWTETAVFPESATLAEVADWLNYRWVVTGMPFHRLGNAGRVYLTYAERPSEQEVAR